MTSISFPSLALFASLLFKSVLAQIDYAVYYDTGTTSYNPFGSGYNPRRPVKWSRVDAGAWPIFLDWGEYLEDPSSWNKGNQCTDRSSSSYSTNHRQSPIQLKSDVTCDDRHTIDTVARGKCQQSEPTFYLTAYGPGVDLTKCSASFKMDISRDEDPWFLQEIVLKSPAEHTIIDPNTGVEQKFAAELQMNFRGSNDGYDPKTSHSTNIGTISVLLTTGGYDAEFEKLLRGWESATNKKYESCRKTYDHTNCKLNSYRLRRELEQDDLKVSSLLPLKEDLDEDHERNLSEYEKSGMCAQAGTYYCWENLYLHTNTHFYYNYLGSLTYPPCTENVFWRVMQAPVKISSGQLNRIKRLTYMYLNNNCELGTVGTKLSDCQVAVNRPLQKLSNKHNLKKCDAWVPSSFSSTSANSTYTIAGYTAPQTGTAASSTSTNNLF